MQVYSDPLREADPHALPDVEVFYQAEEEPGWYFWFCFPGCLPDSDPIGPYRTKRAAIAAARGEE